MKLSVIKAIRYNEITREIEMPHKNPKSQKEKNLYEQLQNTFSETQRKTTGFSPLGFGTDYCWG